MFDWSGLGARPLRAGLGAWLLLPLVVGLAWVPPSEGAEAAVVGVVHGQAHFALTALGAAGHRAGAFVPVGSRQPARVTPARVTFTRAQHLPSQPTDRQPHSQRSAAQGPWWWLAGFLAAALAVAATMRAWRRPSYRVERCIEIAAEPAWLMERLGDLRQWPAWSTLAAFGPGVDRRFAIGDHKPGSAMAWADARRRRQGRIELDGSILPDGLLVTCTRAGSPSVRDLLTFRLAPADGGGGTSLCCVSHGQAPWLARLLDPVLRIETRKGRQLDAELAALKRAAEAAMIAP